MASNNFANIAAATAAGWKLRRPVAQGKFCTELSIQLQGVPGISGSEYTASGEAAASQGAADTIALNSVNEFRAKRYGYDSSAAASSPQMTAQTSPSTAGVVPVLPALTKDKH